MGLINYIKGNRYGKEANQLERESMEDAFLQEALDGYDAVISNHLNSLERLEEKVLEQSARKKKQHSLILYLSVAASIVLIISVGSIFFFNPPKEDLIAKGTENTQQPNAPVSEKLHKKTTTDVTVLDKEDEAVTKENELTKLKEPDVIAKNKAEVDSRNLIQVSDKSISMEESIGEGNNMVATGYGSKNKKDISAVASASSVESIQGKMAGMHVTSTEGSPDADVKVRVRGGGSITQSNESLYIVDGNPVSNISNIPPSDIKSMEVLKDASATAIYGARGANGVILITTKSGVGTGKKAKVAFEQREFKAFFLSKVKKNVCGETKASVEVSFTLNDDQYPSSFRMNKFSCEAAKSEVIRILSYSPRWTKKAGEQVKMKFVW